MFTVFQDSNNHIQIPFKGDFDYLLIKFTYRNTNVFGIFENTKGTGCDYEVNIIEVGSDGTVDKENGQIKLSPRSTWKAKIYGQDGNVNLAPENATFLYDYDFQIKGDVCTVYPSGSNDCLPATAIIEDQDGNVLATEEIPSGATETITINVTTMINVLKGDFSGEFDLSVKDQNGFYNDYDSASVISTLSVSSNPKLGSLATVRVIGGSLAADSVPDSWSFSGDTISQDISFYNELTILYVSSTDIRIVNRLVDAPDVTAPLFTSAPTSTNIQETSFDITATLNENGIVYGYLLANGSPSPTIQEIIDNAQSQFSDIGSGGTLSYSALTDETNYDVYVIAEDTSGNRQDNSILVEVLTREQDVISPLLQTEAGWYNFTNKSVGSFSSFVEEKGNYTGSLINGSPEYISGTRLDFNRSTSDIISLGSTFNFLKNSSDGFSIYLKFNPKTVGFVTYFVGQSQENNQIVIGFNSSNQLQIFTKINSSTLVINTVSDALFSGSAPYPVRNIFIDFVRSNGEVKIYIDNSSTEAVKTSNNLIGDISLYNPTNNWYLGSRNNITEPDLINTSDNIFDHVIINNKLLTSIEKQTILDNA